jgi:hypothetical protein
MTSNKYVRIVCISSKISIRTIHFVHCNLQLPNQGTSSMDCMQIYVHMEKDLKLICCSPFDLWGAIGVD